jgi:hypothetical protein
MRVERQQGCLSAHVARRAAGGIEKGRVAAVDAIEAADCEHHGRVAILPAPEAAVDAHALSC